MAVATAVVVVMVVGSVGCDSTPTQAGAAYAERLRAAVSTNAVMAHLRQLQDIAYRNGGTRQTGTPGYSASVEYVVKALEDKGFDVQTPEFNLGIFHVDAESLTVDGTPVPAQGVEYSGATSPEGVTGPLVVVPSGDSAGCEPADYDALPVADAVVLVDRGGCYLSEKAAAASGRGATGLIIANDVEEKAFSGALLEDDHVTIPVASVSKAEGARLRTRTGNATLVVGARIEHVRAKNVVAQTTTGSAQDVVLVGAHLDSVRLGPGINDNGSGVAAVLETALAMGSDPPVRNAVRFAFFGGEEEWLIGSDDYVKSLDVEDLKDVALYLNFDMVGSPNPGYFTLDGNLSGPTDPEFAQLPEGSAGIEQAFSDFLDDAGIPTQDLLVDGRGDYNAFVRAGIPAGQLFTGSEAVMTAEQAKLWGGRADEPFDPNYHTADDILSNVNRAALDITLPAIAHVIGTYADDGERRRDIPIRADRERRVLRD